MPAPSRTRKRNAQKQGNRYVFTTEDGKKGYQAALEKCSQDWHLSAWFYYRIRGWYRRRRRERQ